MPPRQTYPSIRSRGSISAAIHSIATECFPLVSARSQLAYEVYVESKPVKDFLRRIFLHPFTRETRTVLDSGYISKSK
jgi:hypothetical protein